MDYRGGDSRYFFAKNEILEKLVENGGYIERSFNGFESSKKLIDKIETGKLYFVGLSSHVAIMKKEKLFYYYLELQDSNVNNGWVALDNELLEERFKIQESYQSNGVMCATVDFLIDIDAFSDSTYFKEIIAYINSQE